MVFEGFQSCRVHHRAGNHETPCSHFTLAEHIHNESGQRREQHDGEVDENGVFLLGKKTIGWTRRGCRLDELPAINLGNGEAIPYSSGGCTMINMAGDSTIVKCDNCIYVPFLDILFHNSRNQDRVPPNMRIVL